MVIVFHLSIGDSPASVRVWGGVSDPTRVAAVAAAEVIGVGVAFGVGGGGGGAVPMCTADDGDPYPPPLPLIHSPLTLMAALLPPPTCYRSRPCRSSVAAARCRVVDLYASGLLRLSRSAAH